MHQSPGRPPAPGPASWRPTATICLVAAVLAYVGCSKPKNDDVPDSRSATSKSAEVKAKPTPSASAPSNSLFANWPTPAAALIVSGEQLGYLEPCGCTQGQLGGLLRRYDFLDRLRGERNWPMVLVDLGSLIKDPNAARGGAEQTKVKFRTALKALGVLKYDALALSPDDLKVGVDQASGEFLNTPEDAPKILAANVVVLGLESKVLPKLVVKAGGVTVGITAVVDPEAIKRLKDPSLDLLEVKPIAESLPSVLEGLVKESTTRVLLVQGPPSLAKTLAEQYPEFDIVVRTSTGPDPADEPEEANDGKTLIVNVGQKGKYVGVVGIFEGEGPKYRYQRVMLGTKYDGDATPLKALIEGEFREALKQERIVESFPKHGYTGGPAGAQFLGAEACKSCHPNTFTKWASTKHAQGFESLLHDPKPNTAFDAECVTCHTTGFEYLSGWTSAEATPFLKGNQCENCHGPASRHAAAPDDPALRSALRLTAEQADRDRLCLRCHDEDNSPEFEFTKYWGQVIHSDLDSYDDPKVHAGLNPDGKDAPP